MNCRGLQRRRVSRNVFVYRVIPAKAGIQFAHLDSGLMHAGMTMGDTYFATHVLIEIVTPAQKRRARNDLTDGFAKPRRHPSQGTDLKTCSLVLNRSCTLTHNVRKFRARLGRTGLGNRWPARFMGGNSGGAPGPGRP